ncbi:hypothetical protein ACFYPN_05065 [Streptomyces sp. NPDC005576]|uniref:hypothetical protein n=1 Tax=Streptomyces sp. NPDC005576 TaxID=3364726 RepID=UPI003689D424
MKGAGLVTGEMYTDHGQTSRGSTPKDALTILNSLSRALAQELGCSAEAKLSAEVPDGHKAT